MKRSLIQTLDLIIKCQKKDIDKSIDEIMNQISKTDVIFETLNLGEFD
jgi:hypothetical protein